jgi:hypothetical protein
MPIRLFITIDAEEDLWNRYQREDNPVENFRFIPRLQAVFERFGAVPTYFVDWPVVMDARAQEILRDFSGRGRCEIGTHCHPWNTPPFEEELNAGNTMLCNLPEELVRRKLHRLHEAVAQAFGLFPRCFRAGRWGMSPTVARCIDELGYRIDSSVTPFIDWRPKIGPDYSSAPTDAYRFEMDGFPVASAGGGLLEVPATIGFFQRDFRRCFAVRRVVMRAPLRRLRIEGMLDRLGMINLRWLSPETSNAAEMIRLSKTFVATGHRFLNMFFHSATLLPGATYFVKDEGQLELFIRRIEAYLEFAADSGYEFAPLSRALEMPA